MKYEKYGFRRFPYELSHQVRVGIATLPGKLRADWTGEFYAPLDPAKLSLYAMASQVEVQNFFGIGNESPYNESLDLARFYKVEQNQLFFRTTVDSKVEASTRMLMSAGFKIVDNSLLPNTLIDSLKPYGSAKNFSIANVGVQFLHDSRNDLLFPSGGWYGFAELEYYPDWFTNQNSFLRLKAELRSYIPVATGTLALRGIAESISGNHPFFESAFVGGPNSLRGYEVQRFAGDAAVFAGGEVRLPVAQYLFLVPQWFGVSAFAEAGRVFVDGEHSSAVHSAAGAGVWFSFIKREYVGTFSVARSDEKFFFYGSIGFGF
jgi:outer membrane protein assembly factor BamA